MLKDNLEKIGITSCKELFHNLSYEDLFKHETDPALEGYEKAVVTSFGAVNVDTGRFTGRSPKAKYFVKDDSSRDTLWWAGPDNPGSDNKPVDKKTWDHLYQLATKQLSGKKLYITDGYAGANPETRLSVRVVAEVAWQSHFCKNMFIRPTADELGGFGARTVSEDEWRIAPTVESRTSAGARGEPARSRDDEGRIRFNRTFAFGANENRWQSEATAGIERRARGRHFVGHARRPR